MDVVVVVVIFVLCCRKDPESKFEKKKLTDIQLAKISTRKDPVTL